MRNEAMIIYNDHKIAHYTELRNHIQVSGLFSSKERPQYQEPFEKGKHATLDGGQLSSEKKRNKYR